MPDIACGVRARQIADGFAGNYRSQTARASLKLLGYRYREQARSHPDLGLITASATTPIPVGASLLAIAAAHSTPMGEFLREGFFSSPEMAARFGDLH